MPTFDITYLQERKSRIEAADLDAAKIRANAMVLAAKPAKLLSVHPHPYVEPPKVEEPPLARRGCQCPECTSQANFDEWSAPIFKRLSYRDVTIIKRDDNGPVKTA